VEHAADGLGWVGAIAGNLAGGLAGLLAGAAAVLVFSAVQKIRGQSAH
jgi:hypothetical protein